MTSLLLDTHALTWTRKVANGMVMLMGGRAIAAGTPDEMERSEHPFVRRFFASAESGTDRELGDELTEAAPAAPERRA